MPEPTYIQIGHTQKTHGLNGELKVSVEPKYLEDFLKNERVFLDMKGAKVPYFIENLRGGNDPIVKFEDVDNRDAAIPLQSRKMFLREADLVPDHERELVRPLNEYAYLQGFLAADVHTGPIGVIAEVMESAGQTLAVVRYQNREVFIPLHANMIQTIDSETREILFDLPEGLLEM